MAAAYLEPLVRLLEHLQLEQMVDCKIECRHFFSGAAVYADGRICASWSPIGLAFKLSSIEATKDQRDTHSCYRLLTECVSPVHPAFGAAQLPVGLQR